MRTMTSEVKTIVHAGNQGSGLSTITPSAGVDVSGFDGCRFLVVWGAITGGGVQSAEVHQSDDDGASDDYTALAGSKVAVADTDDDTVSVCDVRWPQKRYLKCIVNRATQFSTVHAIIAELYSPGKAPITDDATANNRELHVAPVEGTA